MRLHQRIRREQGRHTDDWLITYADTITLLLCLFVVILSIKTSGKSPTRDAAAPIHQAVASEDFFNGRPPFHALTPITEPAADETPPEALRDMPEPVSDPPPRVTMAAMSTAPTRLVDRPVPPGAERRETAPAALPAIVDRLKTQGTAVVERQGDRITTLQISSAAFFGSGYAALSVTGKSILRDVAVTLKSDGYAGYNISIEGHTDDTPINTAQFQSNWDLSTARAVAVVRFFLEQGIPARKLTAAGYADTFPIAPNRNVDGTVIPDNQARNRRVVIKLEKIDKAQR